MTGAVAERRRAAASPAAAIAAIVRTIVMLAIVAGIAFRFVNLDAKLFSYDEATTSIRVAGYTLANYYHDGFSGRTMPNARFLRYQHVDSRHGTVAVVRSLATEDPQHPPLYYLIERGWSAAFGNAVATRRIVSALAGSAAVVAAVWLGYELTGGLLAGLLLAALMAVSPFFVIYSQQAREYALWELCTILASAALLAATRRGGARAWLIYGITAALGLYTDLLFVYVIAAFALYTGAIAVAERRRRLVAPFAVSTALAVAAFAPWLIAVVRGRALLTNNDYLSSPVPAAIFALKWIFNTGAVFFDLDDRTIALAVVLVPIFALLAYAVYDLVRAQPLRVKLFVATLGLVTAGALVVPDLLHHESRSTAARYLVPAWIALELAIALLLARLLQQRAPAARVIAAAALAGVLLCGVASDARDSSAPTSWAEGKSIAGLAPIARAIDAAPDPLVVYVNDPQRFDFALLALSNEIGPDVRVQQRNLGDLRAPAFGPGTVFVLDPTVRVRAALERSGARLQLAYADDTNDAAPAAVRSLRAQADGVRRAHGVEVDGLALWTLRAAR